MSELEIPEPVRTAADLVMHADEPLARPRPRTRYARATRVLAQHKVLALAVAVALSLLGMQVGVTAASYSDQVAISVEVASGTLDINLDGCEGVTTACSITMEGLDALKPGDSKSKTVAVNNPGSLPAVMTAAMTGTQVLDALGAQLDATLTIAPSGSPTVSATGKASGTTLSAVTIPAGGSVPLTVTLALPADTANSWQGKKDTLSLSLTAVQE